MSPSSSSFDRDDILHTRSGQAINQSIVHIAHEFAVLGYVDVARRLISLFNRHYPLDPYQVPLRWLRLLWVETGSWPEGELEKFKDSGESVEELVKASRISSGRIFSPRDHVEITDDIDGFRLLLKVIDHQPTWNPEFADASTGGDAMSKSAALAKAYDLSLLLAEQQSEALANLPSPEQLLGRISKRLHCNHQLDDLPCSRKVWKELAQGALAKAVGVQDDKVRALAEEVEQTFRQRCEEGLQRMPDQPIEQLLSTIDKNTRTNKGALEFFEGYLGAGVEPETLYLDPAGPAEILELERRLNVTLPNDYKTFLSISNGFAWSWNGIIMDAPLHPASKLRWFRDDETYFTELSITIDESFIHTDEQRRTKYSIDAWPTVGRAIEIGHEDIDNVWLLPPENTKRLKDWYLAIIDDDEISEQLRMAALKTISAFAGSRKEFEKLDWLVLTWASGGSACMTAYASFKVFLEEKARASGTCWDDEDALAYRCR
ncbi:hypothetical protein K402DRAFT_398822 [Aulographum hederae CBS 113979]|uniref:Knr4/Smi1-like domain-containing protein n=1 Tax=Aulographum hederae CBS 113979 TaxID=1176131 RepID=A0A6G1GJK2_9PEZI|nr:hypothetical protein K402DRAFT_398822 [Aulographum hederae CBS 113979]